MLSIKAWCREVIIEKACLGPWKTIEMVFSPLPDITKNIMETFAVWWIMVNRLKEEN